MPYTTADEVRNALAPDGDDDPGTAASLDDDDLEREIDNVQAEVDARLRSRYTVPFEDGEVPDLIQNITIDIAAYLATLVHRRGTPLDVDDPVRLRYARARDNLTALSKGQMELIGVSGPIEGVGEAAVVNPYEGSLFVERDLGLVRNPTTDGIDWAGTEPW